MNKEDIILRIARDHFPVDTLETRNRDSLDFHEVSVGTIRAALLEALERGIELGQEGKGMPQAAPVQRRSKEMYVHAAKTIVTVYEPLQGFVRVRLAMINGPRSMSDREFDLDVTTVDNVELLAATFEAERVDVFSAAVTLLGAHL